MAASISIEKEIGLSRISVFRSFPLFIMGTMLAIIEVFKEIFKLKRFSLRVIDLIGIVSLVFICLSFSYYYECIFGVRPRFHKSSYYIAYGIGWTLVLTAAVHGRGLVKRLLEFKFLRLFGTISYSLYLFHMPVLLMVGVLDIVKSAKIYVYLFVSFVVSVVSYLIVERPLSRVRLKLN